MPFLNIPKAFSNEGLYTHVYPYIPKLIRRLSYLFRKDDRHRAVFFHYNSIQKIVIGGRCQNMSTGVTYEL
jgi:hypothetical protein